MNKDQEHMRNHIGIEAFICILASLLKRKKIEIAVILLTIGFAVLAEFLKASICGFCNAIRKIAGS
jgi:diacylglycerol kinase